MVLRTAIRKRMTRPMVSALSPLARAQSLAQQGSGQATGVGQGGGMQTLTGTGQQQGGGQIGPIDPRTGRSPASPYITHTGTGSGQGTGQASGQFVPAGHPGGGGIIQRPPPGTYDPALDAQEGQAIRGYGDLVDDTIRNRTYTTEDFNRAKDWTNTQTGWQVADLKTGHAREGQDYATGNTIRKENFDTATGERQRQYGLLGGRQLQSQNASGLLGTSGASALAAKIRAANQGREQGMANTDFQRAQTEADLGHTRAGEDYTTGRQRVHDTKYHSLGELGVQVQRTRAGYDTTLKRGSRELNQFKIDTNRSRFYEARSNNRWKPKKSLVKALKKKGLIY
jgi:hypothetical protein